ncbi:aldehyde ferredoxin oxidoreductase N-terminal domain-containing protein [Salidesulfovibrio onnuriiensis]|uniref:aldehyde ferredoxin oxidoreductase N-terminal domain-containing protein n=1 Tax=Salidesulfovibrio onnuriiensis TaxID=2583823 RepID=UPI0011CA9CBF|nr:aldehyde ferredoxin oxidoreductase N-terminal domain-containing protein [Salidesulfovibrio onnuriiensis]
MIRDFFRVSVVDLDSGRMNVAEHEGRDLVAGGGGLAAMLFREYGHADRPWDDPDQPLIFAIGPLTGYFPLMSKTVCAFKSPYHDQYSESHAGGRSALSMRFGDMDALVIKGRARRLSALCIGARRFEIRDVEFLRGRDTLSSGKILRSMFPGSGRRSMLRIGPAGENGCAYACINVDTYRHFGRMGAGGVMGSKNLKAIVILGDRGFALPETPAYPKLFQTLYQQLTDTEIMNKYHGLGTAVNVAPLNELKSLPWRNLQATHDPEPGGITGEKMAEERLLRNAACAGCPVGCIHIGYIREQFKKNYQYRYRQVGYDYELLFAVGSMLGVTDSFNALQLMDTVELMGLDVMSAGVALAWATEALEKGILTEEQTIVPLRFGDAANYEKAIVHLGRAENDFYALLARGTLKAASVLGGADFACVLGQEMAGYATGEVFFVAEALGFRHAHLDTGGYSYDQKHEDKDVRRAVDFLVEDEKKRCFLTAMVSCLFARGVYGDDMLGQALESVGYARLAQDQDSVGENIQRLRWRTRIETGYDPDAVDIPKRYQEVVTWKGEVDPEYMAALKREYARRIRELGKPPEE